MEIRQYIKNKISAKGLTLKESALHCNITYQNLSSFLNGKRAITVKDSIALDIELGNEPGMIARALTEEKIQEEMNCIQKNSTSEQKRLILQKIKKNGGLWSYNSLPEQMDDDEIIEEALRHLDFEDMHLIFSLWGIRKIKSVWKRKLVSEGKRMNILNSLLGVLFFNIPNINQYLIKYGNQKY